MRKIPLTVSAALWSLAVSLSAADYPTTVSSFNPAGYWRLNETVPVPIADEATNSGSAGALLNGFYRGTASQNFFHPTLPGAVQNNLDGCVAFSGNTSGGVASSGWVSVPFTPQLNTPVFSAEAWFNTTDTDGSLGSPLHCPISCGDFGAPRKGWLIYQSPEGWNLRMYNNTGTAPLLSISGGGPVSPSTWYHVAVTFDGTTARLYVNGTQVASGNAAGYVPGRAGDLAIGARADAFFGWNGSTDEAAFYTTALSASTVAAHFSAATTNGAGYFAQILADNPVAYYHFGEPFYYDPDPSTLPIAANIGTAGTAANGTEQAGLTTGVAGVPFSGLDAGNHASAFNGMAGYVDCGSTAPELNISGSFTAMAWIKVNVFNRTWQSILTKGDSSWRLHRNGDTDNIGFGTTGLSNVDLTGTRNVNDGQWHHVVAVYDGTSKKIYVDGVLDASVAVTGTLAQNAYAVYIGENAQVKGRVFNGTIDEVALFTNALSQAQIQQIMYAANVPPSIVQQPTAPSSILAGSPFAFTVVAAGNPTLAYQWRKDGVDLTAQTTTALSFGNLTTNDSGAYAVVINNSYGAVTSAVATLNVSYPTGPAALANTFAYPVYNSANQSATLTEVTLEFTGPLAAEGNVASHYSIPGLTVSAARFTNFNQTVVLTTTPQTPGNLYTVTVTGVTDGVGNPLAVNSGQFRTWVSSPLNGIRFEFYPAEAMSVPQTYANTSVDALTHNSLFPDHPTMVTNLYVFDSRQIFLNPDGVARRDEYGARMRGVFVPSFTARYRFYIRSDDASQLFLNPNGADPAGTQSILAETGCCGDWNKYESAAYQLVGGQAYYIELLYKEGGGDDYGKVAVRVDGTGAPPAGVANNIIDPNSLTGPAIGYPYAPADPSGTVALAGPSDISVQANHGAAFAVTVTNPGGWPLAYQWLRNNAPITEATNSTYALMPTTTDNGAKFSVQVFSLGTTITSPQATLTVTADTDTPSVATVHGSTSLNTVVVSFSEQIATPNISSFTIAGHTTLSAVVDATGTNVVLTIDPPLKPGEALNLSVQNVTDLTGHTLTSATSPVRAFVFSRGLVRFDYFGALDPGDNNIFNTLFNDPRWPNNPDFTGFAKNIDSRTIFPDDSHRGYGALMTGLFAPPADGTYIFYLRSDDSSQFFLSDNATPVGIPFLVPPTIEESSCCHSFSALSYTNTPPGLFATNLYAFAVAYKEGGGGDYAQVAAKLETDPTDPNGLSPVPGSQVGVLADPIGSSLTITEQPVNAQGVYVGARLQGDFNANNGDFTVFNYGGPVGPWNYNAGAGSWTNFGPDGCGGPFGSGLRTPGLLVRSSGIVTLTFSHRWNFEFDASVNYDGGQVRVSVNGGPFATVPPANFSANGYNGPIGGTIFGGISSSPGWINQAFVQASAGYASRTFVSSVATLGTFNAGDKIQVEFVASWDECTQGSAPNWEIDSVQLAGGDLVLIPLVSLSVAAESTYQGQPNQYISYFWQRNTGSGFADIPGATQPTYQYYAGLGDVSATYRCTLYSPGASATTDVATVTVTLPLYFERPTASTLKLSWPLPPPPLPATTTFVLEQSPTLVPGAWTTVPTSQYQTTTDLVFTTVNISPTGPGQFYRLKRQ